MRPHLPTECMIVDLALDSAVVPSVPDPTAAGSGPAGVAVSPDATTAYVSSNESGSVSGLNAGTNTIVSTVPVGSQPIGVTINIRMG